MAGPEPGVRRHRVARLAVFGRPPLADSLSAHAWRSVAAEGCDRGRPLRYSAVTGLVDRLRARTGIDFSLHVLRHSAASEWIRAGVPLEVVSKLLTHTNVATTSGTYVHLDVEDLRAALVQAGLR